MQLNMIIDIPDEIAAEFSALACAALDYNGNKLEGELPPAFIQRMMIAELKQKVAQQKAKADAEAARDAAVAEVSGWAVTGGQAP